MHRVTPSVRLIAETSLLRDRDLTPEWYAWLADLGVTRQPDWIGGADGERLIELSARRCYKAFEPGLNPNVTKIRENSEAYHKNILDSGHGSVLEHATATWAIENVSRVFTHELVRNRAGNAFSQESLRYVRLTDLGFWFPPELAEDEEAVRRGTEVIERLEEFQRWLAAHYEIESSKNFGRKKRLTSAFRRFAPIGLATGIVLTTNMRSLRWLIEQRTAPAAEVEIRLVFNQIARIAAERWTLIFQDFEEQDTGDGEIRAWVPKNHKV